MTNLHRTDDEIEEAGPSRWLSIGSVAANWAAQLEARRAEGDLHEETEYVPVAWAAE